MPTAAPSPSSANAPQLANLRTAWVMVALPAALLVAAWVMPDLSGDAPPARSITWAVFMARTFTFHAGIGLALLALGLWCARYRRPALASLIAGIVTMATTSGPWLHAGARPAGPASFRLLDANVLYSNQHTDLILARIREHTPDVIVLEEFAPQHRDALDKALLASHPYRVHALRDDAFGMAIYSRFPFVGTPVLYPPASLSAGQRASGIVNLSDPQIRAVISVDGREVVVQGIHTVPPINGPYLAEQRRLVRWLADWAATETRPTIVTGDFNATPQAPTQAWLLAAGLTDAHSIAGRGRGCTWPADGLLRFAPGVRIDQCFTKGLSCTSIRVGDPVGSDHLPIIADIVLAP